MPRTPEDRAREQIDALLVGAGWAVQDRDGANLGAVRGVAVREFPLVKGHGTADYLLYGDRRTHGVIEAHQEGETLTGVEVQTEKYGAGLPPSLPAWRSPLPFLYQSTGVETHLTNMLDADPRSRSVFSFHRPATLIGWPQRSPKICRPPWTSSPSSPRTSARSGSRRISKRAGTESESPSDQAARCGRSSAAGRRCCWRWYDVRPNQSPKKKSSRRTESPSARPPEWQTFLTTT